MTRTAENDWQQVRTIFDDALRQPVEQRAEFLRQACESDELRAEVESLLSSHDRAESFLETPAVVHIAELSDAPDNQLVAGQLLGHYEIVRPIGFGGMGEVYLARDTKLNRNVAIKLLHVKLLADGHANRRLLREARAAALLEHPNICHVYEISETSEHSFIVMQYLVGSTLAEILRTTPLDASTSIELAIQIADGLAEAHSHSIIHRDIKPANIIVTNKGQVKILDFGLAKFVEAETENAQGLHSSGAVMGTVPFMSPEQLRGGAVDGRTDIFSLGSLLYEMLSGRPAFTKENNAETISAILNDEPDFSHVPEPLRPMLRKCLAKDKNHRYFSVHDLASVLRDALRAGDFDRTVPGTTSAGGPISTMGSSDTRKRQFHFWQSSGDAPRGIIEEEKASDTGTTIGRYKRPAFAAAAFLIVVLGGVSLFIWNNNRTALPANLDSLRAVRLVSWKSGASSNDTDYHVSHDGKFVAYSSTKPGGGEAIYVKQTGAGEEIRITKDEWRNVSPIWSPDDQRVAYVSIREDQPGIYVSPSLGGASTAFKVTEKTNIALRHWSKDGSSIFYEQMGNLYRLDLVSREAEKVTQLDDSTSGNHRFFSFSPDETQLAFCDKRNGQRDVWIMPVEGGEPIRLTDTADEERRPVWHTDGTRVLYNVIRNGFSQIDFASIKGGSPVQVTRGEGSYELIDVSPDGSRVYYTSWEKKSDISVANVDTGEESEIAAGIETEFWPDVSPDGNSVVYQMNASPNPTGTMSESTLIVRRIGGDAAPIVRRGFNPRWLPDNRRIAFLRWDPSQERNQLWLIDTITNEETQLTTDSVQPPSYGLMPIARADIGEFDFSPDGNHFVFLDGQRPRNIRLGSFSMAETQKLTDTQTTDVRYASPLFSPDGKTIASVSARRSADKTREPESGIAVFQGGSLKMILKSGSLRLVGWSNSGTDLILQNSSGPMKAGPIDFDLEMVSMKGGSETIATLTDVHADTMTLSPDRLSVAFVARRSDKDDIWVLILKSRETRKITNNGNTRTFYSSLEWSPTGKTIFFDKQEQVNTISMFENFN